MKIETTNGIKIKEFTIDKTIMDSESEDGFSQIEIQADYKMGSFSLWYGVFNPKSIQFQMVHLDEVIEILNQLKTNIENIGK